MFFNCDLFVCILGSLIRELGTYFSNLSVLNRKDLFVYCGDQHNYYMRFREDIHLPTTPGLIDDSLLLSDSNSTFGEPPSPQVNNNLNSSMRIRQRHDSVSVKNPREKIFIALLSREIRVFM